MVQPFVRLQRAIGADTLVGVDESVAEVGHDDGTQIGAACIISIPGAIGGQAIGAGGGVRLGVISASAMLGRTSAIAAAARHFDIKISFRLVFEP